MAEGAEERNLVNHHDQVWSLQVAVLPRAKPSIPSTREESWVWAD